MIPLMPSPGIPKMVSTPQSMRLSTRMSDAVFAIACPFPSAVRLSALLFGGVAARFPPNQVGNAHATGVWPLAAQAVADAALGESSAPLVGAGARSLL